MYMHSHTPLNLQSNPPLPPKKQGFFVQPTIAAVPPTHPALQDEVFAPIMYVVKVSSLEEAIALNNAVPQGLSSALFTRDPGAIFKWTGRCVRACV